MTDELSATQKAQAYLDSIPDFPWKLNLVTNKGDSPAIGTLRDVSGRPIVAPHPESVSMLTGDIETLEFLRDAPQIISSLLEERNELLESSKVSPNNVE